jgi:hypothetical protein
MTDGTMMPRRDKTHRTRALRRAGSFTQTPMADRKDTGPGNLCPVRPAAMARICKIARNDSAVQTTMHSPYATRRRRMPLSMHR